MSRKRFGVLLRGLRKARKLSLRDLAKLSDVDSGQIWQLEQGRSGASPETIERLARALKVSDDDLAQAAGVVPVYVAAAYLEDPKAVRRIAMRVLKAAGK